MASLIGKQCRASTMRFIRLCIIILTLLILNSVQVRLSHLQAQDHDAIHILAVDWSSDGTKIAAVGIKSTGNDGYIFVFDLTTGNTIYYFETQHGGFASVAWSHNDHFIAVGSYDQTVKIIDMQSEQVVNVLTGHRWVVDSLDWSPDGRHLVTSSSGDSQVILWNLIDYIQIRSIEISDPWAVAFSPDGQHIAVGGLAGLLVLPSDLNIPLQADRQQYIKANKYIGSLVWNHDGSQIAFGNLTFQPTTGPRPNPEITVIDTQTGSVVHQIDVPQGKDIFSIAWNINNEQIASYSSDGWVRVWDIKTERQLDSFAGSPDYIQRGLGFSPYSGRLAYGSSTSNSLLISNADEGFELAYRQVLANNGIQIVVPDPSPERLQAIAESCNAESALTDSLTDFAVQLDALDIPPACQADLLAVAAAMETE